MSDNPLQDFGCRKFEKALGNLASVLEAIQFHRKWLKRHWWMLFGFTGGFILLGLLNLQIHVFSSDRMPNSFLMFFIVVIGINIGRLEAGLKILLLRKVMLEETDRLDAANHRKETSPN